MSFTKNDRKVRSKSGKEFPELAAAEPPLPFADAIAAALRVDFESSPSTIKTVARMTGSNQRTVKNWFDGKNGPNGEHLVILMRESTQVLQTVLLLSGHQDLLLTMKVTAARGKLLEMLQLLDQLAGDAS